MKKIILLGTFIVSLSSFAFGTVEVRGGGVFNISSNSNTTYVKIESEYGIPVLAINGNQKFSFAAGASANVALRREVPMYYTLYINPTFDTKLSNDLMLKTGICYGLGFDLNQSHNISYTKPILASFELQYKQFLINIKTGVKINFSKSGAPSFFNGSITMGWLFNL